MFFGFSEKGSSFRPKQCKNIISPIQLVNLLALLGRLYPEYYHISPFPRNSVTPRIRVFYLQLIL